jgi:hypothetical protein
MKKIETTNLRDNFQVNNLTFMPNATPTLMFPIPYFDGLICHQRLTPHPTSVVISTSTNKICNVGLSIGNTKFKQKYSLIHKSLHKQLKKNLNVG